MSSKSTILLTNLNEHWHTDCSFYSKEGRSDIFLQIDNKNIVELSFGTAYGPDKVLSIKIVSTCEIAKTTGKTSFEIPMSDIEGMSLDDECIEVHISGDSEAVRNQEWFKY